MKHQIKHHYTESVLFECGLPDGTPARLVTRHALEKATAARANLTGANLARTNLDGANLTGAYLTGANLTGANLDGANLTRTNLARTNLDGANLAWTNLARTNLDGANLDGANLTRTNLDGVLLVSERPIFQIGPIGSRCAYFTAYLTSDGVKLRAGCFFGAVDDFTAKLSEDHGDSDHAKEYRAALELIQCHAGLWTPTH